MDPADESTVRNRPLDSGGALNGALLDAGLVDEVSLLVHPALAAATERRPWHGGGPVTGGTLTLTDAQTLPDGLVWLRHRLATSATEGWT